MLHLTLKTRLGLIAGYVALILLGIALLPILFSSPNSNVFAVIRVAIIWLHSLPLLLAKCVEDMLFGGPDPKARGALVFLAIVALQWSPAVVFSVSPRLWAIPVIRNVTVGYLATLLMLSIGAAVWLTMDPSLLAS